MLNAYERKTKSKLEEGGDRYIKETSDDMRYSCFDDLPSSEDMVTMIITSNFFLKRMPDLKLNFKVCGPQGVISYNLTDEGVKFFSNKGQMEIEKIAYEIAVRNNHIYSENPSEHLNAMSNEHIMFQFTPYQEILGK